MKAAATPTIQNRQAHHEYFVEERFEVGIVLSGTEVKSIRAGQISLKEAWVDLSEQMEIWLVGAHIQEYAQGSHSNHLPAQRRKLLAHHSEILKMRKAKELKGLTLIPLKLYFKNRFAKLEIGICRGKDSRDKRQDVLARQTKMEIARAIKDANR